MTERPAFDPFAALAKARANAPKKAPEEACETFAALSQESFRPIPEQDQEVTGNLATFAAFAGGQDGSAASRSSLYLERKKDFSLSFQGHSHGSSRVVASSEQGQSVCDHAPPAKAAILRESGLSHCEQREERSNTLCESFAASSASPPVAEHETAKVLAAPVGYDERAAFLEYECGLPRVEAEAQARAEFGEDAPRGGLVVEWYAAIARLDFDRAPCPGYRGDEWTRIRSRALAFLDDFGEQAVSLGWTAPRLFGVHPEAGAVRVDACGALMIGANGEVRAITADTVSFGHLVYRTKPGQPEGVPVWRFGR